MPVLLQCLITSSIYLAIDDKIIRLEQKNNQLTTIDLPEREFPENLTKGQEESLKEPCEIITADISNEYLMVSTHNKQVLIYNKNLQVHRNFFLQRAASKIRFFPSNHDNLIIADKTGDVYVYDGKAEKCSLLLGHLSMLLDVVISKCEKYVVTCDRDEKIRVSLYPNSYNIFSYCLGHEEFVTNIELVVNYLISSSGDGSVRVWHIHTGQELCKINVNEQIDEKLQSKFRADMDNDNVKVKAVPIVEMQVSQISAMEVLIVVKPLDVEHLFIYVFSFSNVSLSFRHTLQLENKILCFNLTSNSLAVLCSKHLRIYKFQDSQFKLHGKNELIHDSHKELIDKYSRGNTKQVISMLYKRKFDNVQEYLERKKIRLENKV